METAMTIVRSDSGRVPDPGGPEMGCFPLRMAIYFQMPLIYCITLS